MSAPGLLAALVVSAVLYLFGTRRAGRWPRRHTAAWLAGLLALGVALLSRIDTLADHDLHAHMIQHLLLINLAAPLLVAGAPVALALRADGGLRDPLVRALRSRWAAVLLHPVTAVALFTLVLVGTHVPAVYDGAVAHPGLHALEHLAYLASSMLFWTAVLGVRPLPRRRSPLVRVLMLLLAMPPMALVGVALMSTARPAYTRYALVDQHGAGRLMWVAGTLPMGALVLVLAVGAVTEEERRQQRLDRYAALRAGERPA